MRVMEIDERLFRRYECSEEANRLWRPGIGDLVRLRTWDILGRFLPEGGRVADIGGGPGTHAAHLAERGFNVTLVDAIQRHVDQARNVAKGRFTCQLGDARRLDLPDSAFDAVLLLGPLYHLPDPADRQLALREAWRILRPGGRLLAEVITRHAWILDATRKGLISDRAVRETFAVNVRTGLSADPAALRDGGFWAFFHNVEDIAPEIETGGFTVLVMLGVEGHAWLVPNIEELVADPEPLLETLRIIESQPSLLGMSAHVITVAIKPEDGA